MKISIGPQFSREFQFDDTEFIRKLGRDLTEHFKDKSYGVSLSEIYIVIICVSSGFDEFFQPRPFKYKKTKACLEYEVKLDFNSFYNSSQDARKEIVKEIILESISEKLYNVKFSDFNIDLFSDELKKFMSHYF
ncbi:hypothetical protein E0W68_12860 [Flavobacterium salilacus subsp. salilacus]|uniref:Imm44 family immunity protein n=1 Tax=Flavobacterium TaxID=237 RepID=UPI001074DF8F|nr:MULTISPECIES: Imm44 family immunity protein [Flavobacterium]KAF2515835.1 hypothetical protein E0W68_12860 [Flavobacterium salilacus subsp. salilacus]MBE1615360.1 hypothetical protein [Flavobacterium sp. SaA2.13]